MNINKFSERLSFCMKLRNVNAAELSALSGVTAATISRYLNGLRMPAVDKLILIASALDISIDFLLCLHDIPDIEALTCIYSPASTNNKHIIQTLSERYGGKYEPTNRQ